MTENAYSIECADRIEPHATAEYATWAINSLIESDQDELAADLATDLGADLAAAH